MIRKKTFREFDSEFNQWEGWPLELAYRVYSEIMDEVNQLMEEKDEVVADTSATDSDNAE